MRREETGFYMYPAKMALTLFLFVIAAIGSQSGPANGPSSGQSTAANAIPSLPGATAPDPVYRAGNGVSKPTLAKKIEPDYSEIARKLRAQGEAILYAVIRSDGTAENFRVMSSLGYGLDEKAIEAVRKWRFNPGMKDGKAVAVAATFEVRFQLLKDENHANAWYSGPMKFTLAAGVKPPIVEDGAMPKPGHEDLDESATLEFTVDSTGSVKNVHAIHGSPSSTELLIGYLSNWKFRPAVEGNRPVDATGQVRFIKGKGDETVDPPPPSVREVAAASATVRVAGTPPSDAASIRTTFNAKDGQTYVWIPPGNFMMGCSQDDTECNDSEKPAHAAGIAKGFWLGRTEVTQAAYQHVTGGNPSRNRGDQLPVESVTWNDAVNYCTAAGGRLPTEAEWEYAARAGAAGARYGELEAIAWYSGNSGGTTHPVALKQANAFGLYDMLGNVWEWVEDAYPGNPSRMLKGGAPFMDVRNVRASSRFWVAPSSATGGRGFRCAMNDVPPNGRAGGAALASGDVYPVGNGVSRPQLIRNVPPEYSDAGRNQRIGGVVVLRIVVDASGNVTNAEVTGRLGYGLDEKAIEAVKRWKFRPGYKDGKAVATSVTVEVSFRLQ
jgi:TonB family protein